MIVRILYSFIFIFVFFICGAFYNYQIPDKSNNSFLWEIRGKDLQTTSYLYGTVHLICENNLNLPEPVFNALQRSEQLVLELNMTDPQFGIEFQKGMVMQEGSNLRKLLSKEDYQYVSRFFKDSLEIDLQQVEVIKPFYMSSMMYSKILGCQPQPYELELVKTAALNSIAVAGLETVQQQLDLFGSVSYKKQAQMLVEAIKNFRRTKRMYQELLKLYKQQDIEGAYQMLKTTTSGLEDFEEEFLVERNTRWLPIIEEMISTKSSFIAVGAGHLGGETGLIKLLQSQGYTVNPITYTEGFQLHK